MIPFILMFSENSEIKSGVFTTTEIDKIYTGFFEEGEVSVFLTPVVNVKMKVDEYSKYYTEIVDRCEEIHGDSEGYRLSQVRRDIHVRLVKDDNPVMVKDLKAAELKHSKDIVDCVLGIKLLCRSKNTLISKLSVSDSYINVILINSKTKDVNIVSSDVEQIKLMNQADNPFIDFTTFMENCFC